MPSNPAIAGSFALLGLNQTFTVDEKALEQAYFRQQQLLHPDRNAGKPEKERRQALQQSIAVNDAYQTLKSPLKRAQHLLALNGIRVGGDADTQKPSARLLGDVMEWREELDAVATPEQFAQLEQRLSNEKHTLLARLEQCFALSAYNEAAELTLRLGYLLKTLADFAPVRLRLERVAS